MSSSLRKCQGLMNSLASDLKEAGESSTLTQAVSRDMLFPRIGLSQSVPLPGFVLYAEARLPSVDVGGTGESFSRNDAAIPSDTVGPGTTDPLRVIPTQVVDYLLEIYISRCMASHPIFYEPWLRACHASVIHPGESGNNMAPSTPYEQYTISLVMAVALSTAARSNRREAGEMAFELFKNALRHMSEVTTNDFAGLQALVLLHSYAVMNPTAANLYFLGGYTTQLCIDLGLHREDLTSQSDDIIARDIKRRVFWTAWELDASSSAGFGRPFALLPQDITTGFPTDFADGAIGPDYIDERGSRSKFICNRVRVFRLIETEVISILFHDHPFPPGMDSHETWAADVEARMNAWLQDIHHKALSNQDAQLSVKWEEMALFAEIATPLITVDLYRPCPRVKTPQLNHLLKAFEASIQVVQGYRRQASTAFGSPKYTFGPCHHVFASAMVFLHALRTCPSALRSHYSDLEMEASMTAFSDFFAVTAERWPASLKCLDEYQRILEPLKERYFEAERALSSIPLDDLLPANGFLGYEDFVIDSVTAEDFTSYWTGQELTYLDWADHFDLEGAAQ
ncbi:uncharacterized protein E0L32_003538 [Thyridium curvatum]|uniref:Xylanolytic transcriptional activator regulatory domain-containing protein n=1 Tax=Thyridium curvatum TaxID=1093900 RepID=A0A507BCK5_9PEZI|nr:uncharacterized protein E0L32_003538 [Thyridium curvatum]TPX16976.1 hypothetical protein E0L32_003538 [Thyridium curvatum]